MTSVSLVLRIVARHYELTLDELTGECRERRLAWPRQVAMFLCREHTRASTTVIARRFGKDHTTLIHAVQQVRVRMALHQRDLDIMRTWIEAYSTNAELDTLAMRVYSAVSQQARWDDPQFRAVVPEPVMLQASVKMPMRKVRLNTYGARRPM